MSLIKCSECGKDVSDKAPSCPACGNPIAARGSARNGSATAATDGEHKKSKPAVAEQAVSWGLTVVVVAAAFVFNPSEAAHKAKIRMAIEEKHPITGLFGVSKIATLDVKYESFGFMSLTERGSKTVSMGLYGYVHVFNP